MIPHDFDPTLDLMLTRDLNAPRELLYACWTVSEHMVHWFVPKPHRVTACTLDPRPGGVFNTTFDVGGNVIENTGVFLEVVPNEKVVFTDTYTVGWKPATEPFMTAIVTFADLGDGRTRYTAIARHRTAETAQKHADMGFQLGWGMAATQLEEHARTLL